MKRTVDSFTVHRFKPRGGYIPTHGPQRPVTAWRAGLYVDCETTGLDTAADHIIELAVLPFAFNSDGVINTVGAGESWFNDPGIPISEEVTALTGVTQAMVAGQSIDVPRVEALYGSASLVIAHHAEFDRQMIERAVPSLAPDKPWACSWRDVDWSGTFGTPCGKLEHLLLETCDEFYEPHRALLDCQVGLHVLATAETEGQGRRSAFSMLLESARQKSVRVSAVGAPFEVKDALKARKYSWNAGAKVWYRDVREGEVEAEMLWLNEHARCHRPTGRTFDARDRYSERVR